MPNRITRKLIAPCGMNCGICMGYLREKDHCPGCRARLEGKPEYCQRCIIVHCDIRNRMGLTFCGPECEKFPCRRLRDLDKRYRTKYHMSMLENLETIREVGINQFVKQERMRWTCESCGGIICVHRSKCWDCGSGWSE